MLLGAVVAVTCAGCGSSDPTTTSELTTTAASVTTTRAATTTTVVEEVGPQPLPSSGLAEPGDYYTTVFEPTVRFRIERALLLRPFQFGESATGFQNRDHYSVPLPSGLRPYRGLAVHNYWLGLSADEVIAEIAERETLDLGPQDQVEVAGFPGTQLEAIVNARTVLWGKATQTVEGSFWVIEPGQMTRLIVLETPAGSLLITISADVEEWNEFLATAEEILAGISFPDFE